MEELGRLHLVVGLVLAFVVCALGVRYLREQHVLPAVGDGGSGGAPARARGDGGASPSAAGGEGAGDVSVGRAGGGRVTVHVAGMVRRPGLYHLRAGARIDDAIRRAGGARARADLAAVNLAAKVEDGRQVLVPQRGAAAAVGAPPTGEGTAGGSPATGANTAGGPGTPPVNLNTATPEQLDTLDGVGPGIAQRILDYRTEHGGFTRVDELAQVPGIGPKRMETLRPLVTA